MFPHRFSAPVCHLSALQPSILRRKVAKSNLLNRVVNSLGTGQTY